jgi:predicted Zn-dependent peptidase
MTRHPLLLCLALAVPGLLHAQARGAIEPRAPSPADGSAAAAQENLFAGFETHVLDNGLKVWFRHIPGAANTSVAINVPYGRDMDPVGKEESAHFVEHMLFGDHRGVSEEEIKDQVESVGGTRNGLTAADRTHYFVTIPAELGLFGIEWLSRIIEPHEMDPDVVERNRQPVALEIRARPRELFDHLGAYLNPDWLRRPDAWERDFGLVTRESRQFDRYRSLHAITPQDLRDFYDRYYVPEAMTLMVAGDLPGDSALNLIHATFGQMPAGTAAASYPAPVDPEQGYRQVTWQFRPNVQYRRMFRVYDQSAESRTRLLFLGRYLSRRLNAELRFGDTKAVYGISVGPIQRGPAQYLAVQAPVDRAEWEFARGVIDRELQALADGSTPQAEFEADRQAVVERVIAENREPQDLVNWLYRWFHPLGIYDDFPDVPAEFSRMDQADLSAFVSGWFVPEREVELLDYPQPLSQGLLALLAVCMGVLVMKGTAKVLTRPIEMKDIRYVARIRLSLPILIIGGATFFGFAIVAGRLFGFVAEWLFVAWVLPVESYALQLLAFAIMGSLSLVLPVLYLSIPPRKILVFPDHILVKSRVYRSRKIPLVDIESVARRRIADVARRGRLFSTLPLSMGLGPAAVHLEIKSGAGYLCRVRDPKELMAVLEELGVPVES